MHFSAFTFVVHVYSSDTTDELLVIAMENKWNDVSKHSSHKRKVGTTGIFVVVQTYHSQQRKHTSKLHHISWDAIHIGVCLVVKKPLERTIWIFTFSLTQLNQKELKECLQAHTRHCLVYRI